MVIIGAAFLLYWTLIAIFRIDLLIASLVVGVLFILLGLILGERPVFVRRP